MWSEKASLNLNSARLNAIYSMTTTLVTDIINRFLRQSTSNRAMLYSKRRDFDILASLSTFHVDPNFKPHFMS